MNDERPIEKLLRRYAKERRADAGAPVEMHPATRRLLQGEVARQLGAERRKPISAGPLPGPRPFWVGWLPRLAWMVPVVALVAIGAWRWLDQPATKQLALGSTTIKKTTATAEADSLSPKSKATVASSADARVRPLRDSAPTPASAPARALNPPASASGLADQYLPATRQVTNQALAFAAAPNPPPASLVGGTEQVSKDARFRNQDLARADKSGGVPVSPPLATRSQPARKATSAEVSLATRPAALEPEKQAVAVSSATAPKVITITRNESSEPEPAHTYSQAFARQIPAAKEKAAQSNSADFISPVLANFRIEQTGRQLRVVDGDGSTYIGEAEPALTATSANGSRSKREQFGQLFQSGGKLNQLPAGPAAAGQQPVPNHLYRVVGTNRTLNQNVVFTWNFVELTNTPFVAESVKAAGGLSQDAKKLPTQFPGQFQNSFITGRAQFGSGKEIEINAVPVSP